MVRNVLLEKVITLDIFVLSVYSVLATCKQLIKPKQQMKKTQRNFLTICTVVQWLVHQEVSGFRPPGCLEPFFIKLSSFPFAYWLWLWIVGSLYVSTVIDWQSVMGVSSPEVNSFCRWPFFRGQFWNVLKSQVHYSETMDIKRSWKSDSVLTHSLVYWGCHLLGIISEKWPVYSFTDRLAESVWKTASTSMASLSRTGSRCQIGTCLLTCSPAMQP